MFTLFRMDNLENWLILQQSWIGWPKFKMLLESLGSVEAIVKADKKILRAAKLSEDIIEKIKNPNRKEIQKALEFTNKEGNYIIHYDHPQYPSLLKEISDPPLLFYLWGDPEILSRPNFAIVGSRNPSPGGAENAFHFARELSARGLVICSGMAMGIDGESHRGALDAKGKTLAILGSGLRRLYPPAHRKLASQIAENGAVLSEFSLEAAPAAAHFPARNRLIAGMSLGTLVVEAALRSGSLITARMAMEQNREVFAIPGSIHSPHSKGCHAILKEGATLVESVDDILKQIGQFTTPTGELVSFEAVQNLALNAEEQELLRAIGFDQASVDQLVSRLDLSAGIISARLLSLELRGYIKPLAGGYVRVKGNSP